MNNYFLNIALSYVFSLQVMNKVSRRLCFHPTWVYVMFRRFFQHQNVIVVKWGAETFLKADVNALSYSRELMDMITGDLLQVSGYELYSMFQILIWPDQYKIGHLDTDPNPLIIWFRILVTQFHDQYS